MTPTLRPYQVDLYNRVCEARRKGSHIIVVQGATGSGKNSWAAFVVKRAAEKGTQVLFMVHRRKLVEQIRERLYQFQVDHGIVMRGFPPDPRFKVQVASRDTLLSRCVRNEWLGLPPATLVIVDEAHHAAGDESEYRRILSRYPGATILLLSATPVGPDGAGLGPWAQAIECAAPTSELVRDGYLVPVKCFAPDRKKRGKKFMKGLAGDLVESWKQYGEDRPTVLFCSRVQHSLDAVKSYQDAGIPAVHVDADTPDEDRERAFEDVSTGKVKILSNVSIIGEGVDLPDLGCCQLFCEMGSRVRFLQAVGRVMRPAPGKTHGILIDHSGAVFKHGFPDEDTEWTLMGNVNEDFKAKQEAGETEQALYCKQCELLYHGTMGCPQCGRMPVKPPRSIFAPPPEEPRNELLVEADRENARHFSREEKIQTWFACLNAAKKRNGTFGQAGAIYRKKYNEWPDDDFPMTPARYQWKCKVADVFPEFGKKQEQRQ